MTLASSSQPIDLIMAAKVNMSTRRDSHDKQLVGGIAPRPHVVDSTIESQLARQVAPVMPGHWINRIEQQRKVQFQLVWIM